MSKLKSINDFDKSFKNNTILFLNEYKYVIISRVSI